MHGLLAVLRDVNQSVVQAQMHGRNLYLWGYLSDGAKTAP
jgi:hypothetical protein